MTHTDSQVADEEVFYVENPFVLLQSNEIIPRDDESLERRFNAISRCLILVWLGLYLVGYGHHLKFLAIGLFSVIILYYLQVNTMTTTREAFSLQPQQQHSSSLQQHSLPLNEWQSIPRGNALKIQSPTQYRFCMDESGTGNNSEYYSNNQALAQSAPNHNLNSMMSYGKSQFPGNPRINQKPISTAPIFAFDYWSQDFVIPSGINDSSNTELFQSGYLGTSKCNNGDGICLSNEIVPAYNQFHPVENDTSVVDLREPYMAACGGSGIGGTTLRGQRQGCGASPITNGGDIIEDIVAGSGVGGGELRESFAFTLPNGQVIQKTAGDVLGCSYNPELLKRNLPSNSTNGPCMINPVYDQFNKNLYTETIQPGVYAKQNVVDPLNSNMGITWTQQFEPVSCSLDEYGNRIYTTEDPRVYQKPAPIPRESKPENSNIYDPRYTGYGTQYRQYIDPMSGQPRFYYDDVDAIRRPNYIVRSNVDTQPWADAYGPMNTDNIPVSLALNQPMAMNAYLNDQLGFRTELQERYMRKYNKEIGWQRRQAPIQTTTAGGLRGFRA